MKKFIFMMVAMIAMAFTSANAQGYEGSKLTDNISVGLHIGGYTPMKGHAFFGDIAPTVGITATKQLTPIFGIGVEAQSYVNAKGMYHSCAFPYTTNISGLFTVNATNLILGYQGAPRTFEVEAVYGLGWGHIWGDADGRADAGLVRDGAFAHNYMTSKAGVNLNYTLGKEKEWTVALKPAVVWNLDGHRGDINHNTHYDINNATLEISAGITYHLKSSNGKRYMTPVKPYDAAEIAALNGKINDLQAQLAKKPQVVTKVREVLKTNIEEGTFVVMFAKNSAVLSEVAKATLDVIKTDKAVSVVGYASPEGTDEYNLNLSERRAKAVADYLTARGVKVAKVTGKGESIGETSNRIVIVTIDK